MYEPEASTNQRNSLREFPTWKKDGSWDSDKNLIVAAGYKCGGHTLFA